MATAVTGCKKADLQASQRGPSREDSSLSHWALALSVLVAVGCGGSAPQGAVATVDGVPTTKAQIDQYLQQATADADSSGRSALPSPGPAAYQGYASQAVSSLVQQQVVINAAAGLKITLSDQQVQAQLEQMAVQYDGVQRLYAVAQTQVSVESILWGVRLLVANHPAATSTPASRHSRETTSPAALGAGLVSGWAESGPRGGTPPLHHSWCGALGLQVSSRRWRWATVT